MRAGILDGDENGNAAPNAVMTREEMAKMAASALEKIKGVPVPEPGEDAVFGDWEKISGWARPYVTSAADMGLIVGMEDGSFRPGDSVLREQAMVVIYRLLNQS